MVPPNTSNEYVRVYKQARRRDDDISIVNACFRIEFDFIDKIRIKKVWAAYGGMAATTVWATQFMQALEAHQVWDRAMVDVGCAALARDFPLAANVPGGMAGYRQTLASSLKDPGQKRRDEHRK